MDHGMILLGVVAVVVIGAVALVVGVIAIVFGGQSWLRLSRRSLEYKAGAEGTAESVSGGGERNIAASRRQTTKAKAAGRA
jgi:uncharacterized membrane protein